MNAAAKQWPSSAAVQRSADPYRGMRFCQRHRLEAREDAASCRASRIAGGQLRPVTRCKGVSASHKILGRSGTAAATCSGLVAGRDGCPTHDELVIARKQKVECPGRADRLLAHPGYRKFTTLARFGSCPTFRYKRCGPTVPRVYLRTRPQSCSWSDYDHCCATNSNVDGHCCRKCRSGSTYQVR